MDHYTAKFKALSAKAGLKSKLVQPPVAPLPPQATYGHHIEPIARVGKDGGVRRQIAAPSKPLGQRARAEHER
jgi:hypothetical protein